MLYSPQNKCADIFEELAAPQQGRLYTILVKEVLITKNVTKIAMKYRVEKQDSPNMCPLISYYR
jgi:hypothetical protein